MAKTTNTTARGYGRRHQQVRAEWQKVVDAGEAWCTEVRCLEKSRFIRPGSDWDLAHNEDRTGYLGPAHARCNRSEGSRRGNRRRRGRPKPSRRRSTPDPPTAGRFATSRRW